MTLTKPQLDALTDGAVSVLATLPPLNRPSAEYADKVAGYLTVQFPGVPDLGRIVTACAQYMSAIGAADLDAATVVHVLAGVGQRIGGAA